VAWTHTVSPANRFSLYELTLNPKNPLQYDYDGEWRDIVAEEVEIKVMLDDGSLETRSHTFYTSHYGPILNLGGVSELFDGWPINGTKIIISMRDANLTTGPRGLSLWITKGQATNLDEYIKALGIIGNPVFHDLAVDRNGEAFYGEISSIPFITQAQLVDCVDGLIGPILAAQTSNVIVGLNGSRSECEWGTDPEAPEGSNLYGASSLPQLRTTNYVANSNNSYWLSNPEMPITGYPVIMGPVGHENLQQFSRTRIGHVMIRERIAGTDGFSAEPGFTLETLQQLMYSNRVYIAELVLDDVLTICDLLDTPESADETRAVQACGVLETWDRKANLDSRGVQVFNEFWREVRKATKVGFQGVVDDQDFWDIDFNPSDPVNTPSGIDLTLSSNHDLVIAALATAVKSLEMANVALDAPWGEVQVAVKNGERIPIHGGSGDIGVYGAISVGLSDGGYVNPGGGNSYIQTVTFDESDCPIADVILVPSNSTDPESPHFADQTRLYSSKEWIRFPFCEQEIEAAQVGDTLVITEAR
jgi:acyl-homoserine-lactone acylase